MKTFRIIIHAGPLGALLAIVSLISSGCSHSNSPVMHQQGPFYTITDWHDAGFGNPSNPYDSVGLQHNETLHYVGKRLKSVWNDDTLYPGTDTLCVNFLDSIKGFPSDSLSSFLHFVRKALTHSDSLLAAMPGEFGTQATSYFNDIVSVLNSQDSLAGKIDSIKSLEAIASNSLSSYQLVFVQISASIARYSASYWASSDTTLWEGWKYHHRAIVDRQFRKGGARPTGIWGTLAVDAMGAGIGATEWDGFWGGGPVGWGLGTFYSLGSGAAASASGAGGD